MNSFLPFPSMLRKTIALLAFAVIPNVAFAEDANESLSDTDILTTVRINQPVVRQRCWEPRKASVGTTSVRTAIKVTPDGRVETVEASGDSDAMVECVTRQVRTWRFPASKKASTVQVPFKFVMQR